MHIVFIDYISCVIEGWSSLQACERVLLSNGLYLLKDIDYIE